MSSDDVCAICLDALAPKKKKVYVANCQHQFHESCFRRMNNTKCPCCRIECTPTVDHQVSLLRQNVKEKQQALLEAKRFCYWEIRKKEYNVHVLEGKLKNARLALKHAKNEQHYTMETCRQDIQDAKERVHDALQCPELIQRRKARHQKAEFKRQWLQCCHQRWEEDTPHDVDIHTFISQQRRAITAAWKVRQQQDTVECHKTGKTPWTAEETTLLKYQFFLTHIATVP